MDSRSKNLDCKSPDVFIRDERGQLSVMFLLGLIPILILVALIYNTANQTSRKIEMQGASDAAAISSGVWMARGMNAMVLNNNAMAEVLAVMVVVRSLRSTIEIMIPVGGLLARAVVKIPYIGIALAIEIGREVLVLKAFLPVIRAIDNALSAAGRGLGWTIMQALDLVNRGIKVAIPPLLQAEALNYGRQNGAEKITFLVTGTRGLQIENLLPLLPVGRGSQNYTAQRADECPVPKLKPPGHLLLISLGPLLWTISGFVFEGLCSANLNTLGAYDPPRSNPETDRPSSIFDSVRRPGGIFGRILRSALRLIGSTTFLRWPNNPPKPMLLTEQPNYSPSSTTTQHQVYVDLRRVRRALQLLAVSAGARPLEGKIAGSRFRDYSYIPETQLTYAQAEVYNPTHWGMYTQDWRAKLARATVFEQKADAIFSHVGLRTFGRITTWSFVNTH